MFFSISLMAIYVVQIGTNKIQMKTNEINKNKKISHKAFFMCFNTKEIQIKYKWNTNTIVFLLNCVERLYKAHRTTNTHGCTCTLGWPRFYNFFMNHGKSNSAEVLWVMLPNTSMNKSYCSNFFFILTKFKNEGGRAKKHAFFYIIWKIGQNQVIWA